MPRRPSPAESLAAQFKHRRSIAQPVASDTWTYTDAAGEKHKTRLQLGKPQRVPRDPRGNWFCPVYIEGWTPHVVPAIGVGPFDSLTNALLLVRSFRDHVADMHIEENPKGRIRIRER